MEVRNLKDVEFSKIIESLLSAFENYYVPMPQNEEYYEKRWKAAKVDYAMSYGAFDDDKLVGFIIHGIDKRNGKLTAFNTGTGVIPEYRGKRLVKTIYDFALSDLHQKGVEKTSLEVIQENERAVKAYKSVGFKVCKNYLCFSGDLNIDKPKECELVAANLSEVDWSSLPFQEYYSWDFQKESILEAGYDFYYVNAQGKSVAYFILNPANNYIIQFDVLNDESQSWDYLANGISQLAPTIKIINIDDRHTDKLKFVEQLGLKNIINQYELERDIVLS